MSEKLGKGRLPSVRDKYRAACEAEANALPEATKVEKKPERKKRNA